MHLRSATYSISIWPKSGWPVLGQTARELRRERGGSRSPARVRVWEMSHRGSFSSFPSFGTHRRIFGRRSKMNWQIAVAILTPPLPVLSRGRRRYIWTCTAYGLNFLPVFQGLREPGVDLAEIFHEFLDVVGEWKRTPGPCKGKPSDLFPPACCAWKQQGSTQTFLGHGHCRRSPRALLH